MSRSTHWLRIEAALGGTLHDAVPVALWRHFPGSDRTPEGLAHVHVEMARKFGLDALKLTPEARFLVRDWGVAVDDSIVTDIGTNPITAPVIKKVADWDRIEALDPTHGQIGLAMQAVSRIHALVPELPLLPMVYSPFSIARALSGDAVLEHLAQNPERVRRGLDVITETTKAIVREGARRGGSALFFAVNGAAKAVMPWETYAEFARPYDLEVLTDAHRHVAFRLIHLHGPEPYFEAIAHYPAEAINWHDRRFGPSLSAARALTDKALWAGLDENGVINDGTPDQVAAEAQQSLSELGGRGMVLAAGCVLATRVPDSNLRAATQTAHAYTG